MITKEFKEVQRVLKKLPDVLQKKVVTSATRASTALITKEAKKIVTVDTGLLKKSLATRRAKKKNTPEGVIRYFVVPLTVTHITAKAVINGQSGKIKAKVRARHAHLIEFGTKKMKAQPFLLPAVQKVHSQILPTFKEKIYVGVKKEVRKLAR